MTARTRLILLAASTLTLGVASRAQAAPDPCDLYCDKIYDKCIGTGLGQAVCQADYENCYLQCIAG